MPLRSFVLIEDGRVRSILKKGLLTDCPLLCFRCFEVSQMTLALFINEARESSEVSKSALWVMIKLCTHLTFAPGILEISYLHSAVVQCIYFVLPTFYVHLNRLITGVAIYLTKLRTTVAWCQLVSQLGGVGGFKGLDPGKEYCLLTRFFLI